MSHTPERNSLRDTLIRDFESSRFSAANLAAAFELALPTIRRVTHPGRPTAAAGPSPRRTPRTASL